MFLKSFIRIAILMLAADRLWMMIQAGVLGSSFVPLLPLVFFALMVLPFAYAEYRLIKLNQEEKEEVV